MIKRSGVFQPSKDQAVFLAGLSALMSFLIVLALGVALALSNATEKWSRSWDMKATVQILGGGDIDAAKKILKGESARIKSSQVLSEAELSRMLKPWMQGTRDLSGYLPVQIDITFNKSSDIRILADKMENVRGVKFIPHSDAVKKIMVFGSATQVLAVILILFVILASFASIVFATNSIIKIHSREIEILAVVGAYDSFAINHISAIILRLVAIGAALGLVLGALGIFGILEIAAAQKTGIVSAMDIGAADILKLGTVPILLSVGAFMVSRSVIKRTLSGKIFE
ncbi:MAG: hypothetical protein LBH81_02420 [Rickettsiales bacterium]|jgi:cell division protein FtsX|nr:hypothetical protein [Rickettsiales bacterium]